MKALWNARWKIIITIVLAILVSYLFGCSGSRRASKIVDHSPTLGELVNAYRTLNDDYFYGGLPISKTTIVLGDLTAQDDTAMIEIRDDGTWLITIDRGMHKTEKQAEMSLIHEMCHQEDFQGKANEGLDGHSYAFQACMVSVAERGGFKDLW